MSKRSAQKERESGVTSRPRATKEAVYLSRVKASNFEAVLWASFGGISPGSAAGRGEKKVLSAIGFACRKTCRPVYSAWK